MKYLSVQEFRSLGLLQEINRRLLHPIGLALSVEIDDDGTERFGAILDCRDDPEGFRYKLPIGPAEARRQQVNDLLESKSEVRLKLFGSVVQPVSTFEDE